MNEETQVNVPLLRKVITWAINEDAKGQRGEVSAWNQEAWCGTACCIAGYTALELGWEHVDMVGATKDGEYSDVDDIAEEGLGLTNEQAYRLFDGANDVHALRCVYTELTGEEIL